MNQRRHSGACRGYNCPGTFYVADGDPDASNSDDPTANSIKEWDCSAGGGGSHWTSKVWPEDPNTPIDPSDDCDDYVIEE